MCPEVPLFFVFVSNDAAVNLSPACGRTVRVSDHGMGDQDSINVEQVRT